MSTTSLGPRRISRRTLLAGLPAAVLAPALVACSALRPELRLAAGEAGGFYAEFGSLLAAVARDAGLPVRALTTGGSAANIDAVASGGADVGLALADLVLAARTGSPPFPQALDILAIGRVYENYLQLAVRAESRFRDLSDLDGRPVSVGAAGSGAAVTAQRLLETSGVRVAGSELPLAAATTALDDGRVDAVIWSGGVPTPAVAALAARRPIRLIPLGGSVASLRSRYGGDTYSTVPVPPGVYGAGGTVPTIGVANLIVATRRLVVSDAGDIARLLVSRAPDLVPDSALGTQYLDRPALVDTGEVPLHPGAAQAYRDLHG